MATIETSRRDLMQGAGGVAATAALAGPFAGLIATEAKAQSLVDSQGAQLLPAQSPYGAIAPTRDLNTGLFLLQLPQGFSYRSFSWTGDLLSDGVNRVGAAHDGMAVVGTTGGRSPAALLIRNHESRARGPLLDVPGNPAAIYDNSVVNGGKLGGGCSVLTVRNGQLVDHRNTIGGTAVNCAGGSTPWGTWLTMEETVETYETDTDGRAHGYTLETSSNPMETRAEPIVAFGRRPHEAAAIDDVTGYLYGTEDNRNAAGFWRYKPTDTRRIYGALAQGGVLQAAKVVGVDKANLINLAGARPSTVERVGQSFDIEWVTIDAPNAPPSTVSETGSDNPDIRVIPASGCYVEARSKGALRMSRGEGLWYRAGVFYIADTSFGYETTGARRAGRGLGALWTYTPSRTNPERGVLTLVYSANARVAGNNIDNVTISPRGGIVMCDDGAAVADQFGQGQRLTGLNRDGLAYIFAKNHVQLTAADLARMGRTGQAAPGDYRGLEFAGACFDPQGRVLYVNIQTPGITFAITGPWGIGNL